MSVGTIHRANDTSKKMVTTFLFVFMGFIANAKADKRYYIWQAFQILFVPVDTIYLSEYNFIDPVE